MISLGGCHDGVSESTKNEALWTPTPVAILDLDGQEIQVPKKSDDVAQVFIFSRIDCPISNRYAAEVNRIYDEFSGRGIQFSLVFVDPEETPEVIRHHLIEFSYKIPTFRDPERRLVKLSGATVTPEAVIFSCSTGMVYRGRIDDMFVDFGKQRNEPNNRDVRQILTDLIDRKTLAFRETKAIGCYIEELK